MSYVLDQQDVLEGIALFCYKRKNNLEYMCEGCPILELCCLSKSDPWEWL